MYKTILAIETSCDETSAAIIKGGKILSNIIAPQAIHSQYGGVIPEMASRCHIQNIAAVVDTALKTAKIQKSDIHAVACTKGPGLLGALLIGINFAKSLALSLGVPFIGVNHILAHVVANFIDKPIKTPLVCLLVSGGHTQIIALESDIYPFAPKILGRTLDDSMGEAFDKVAKTLGLPYPGGPLIDKLAQKGDPNRFSFPDTKTPHNNMSFSGIKTAFLYFAKDNNFYQKFASTDICQLLELSQHHMLYDICASIQDKLVHMAITKFEKAIIEYQKTCSSNFGMALAGGVSANSLLRQKAKELQKKLNLDLYIPKLEYCTDNAAMIAKTAALQFNTANFHTYDNTYAQPRLKIYE